MGKDAFSAENDHLRKSRNLEPLTKLQKSPHMVPGYSEDRVDWSPDTAGVFTALLSVVAAIQGDAS